MPLRCSSATCERWRSGRRAEAARSRHRIESNRIASACYLFFVRAAAATSPQWCRGGSRLACQRLRMAPRCLTVALANGQARLRRAGEAASDAVVAARVTVARQAEAAAAEAVLRAKEAAGVPMATDCMICMERCMDTALDCGHRACGTCARLLAQCALCRTPVRLRLRLY